MAAASQTVSPGKLRVGIVAPSLRWVGGQAVQADLLVRGWQNDPAVEAQLIRIDPQLPRWISWVEHIPYLRTLVRQPFYWRALWRHLGEVEIAHIFSASYWSFLLAPAPAWFVARMRGKKTLVNYRSGEASKHLREWRTALPVLRRADRLVVPSGYLVEVFRRFGLEAQVVPNVVDLSQFRYRRREPLRPELIFTRGFGSYYGADVVVRAFAIVKKTFPDATLRLLGRGQLEAPVRSLVTELGLTGVEFVGAVARDQIQRFYDSADIFINASWLDNMPVSILEAFASGTPVVSTAPEGIRYLVEHERTGLLSEPRDCEALALNVMCLLQRPDLAMRLADNAHQECLRYRWEAVRAQWLEVYQSMLFSRGSGNGTQRLRAK
jgi:glycosyltransferase involved in cell wall biosynthesis